MWNANVQRTSKKERGAFLILALLTVFLSLTCMSGAIPALAAGTSSLAGKYQPYTNPEGDYYKQDAAKLFADDAIVCSDESIDMKVDEKSNALVISGTSEVLAAAKWTISKTYDFNQGLVSRFSLDASSAKGSRVKLGFFLDDAEEPFATVTIAKQRKKGTWTYSKENSQDVTSAGIVGQHTISFKVLESTGGNVSFCIKSFEMCQSDVPCLYFDIDESEGTVGEMNSDLDHKAECYGSMRLQVPAGYVGEYTNKTIKSDTYDLEYIRGRGNSTWMPNKKPYKIKFDKKVNLLGMGKNKHWVLLANYYDNSLLRNKLTYSLGDQMGMDFTPKSVCVDVVMNGEYYGSYFLTEQIRVGETRVNVRDLTDNKYLTATDEKTINGGYLLSMEPWKDDDTKKSFSTKRGYNLLIESPDFEDYYNEAQFNYIKNYVQKTENALYGENFCDENGVSYKEYLDIESAAKYFLFQSFTLNGDGYGSGSSYMYKTEDAEGMPGTGKLFYGPLWDFDYVAWGSTEYQEFYTEGWYHTDNVWVSRLLQDPEFVDVLKTQWVSFKQKLEAAIADGGLLDQNYARTAQSASYNFEKHGMSQISWGFEDDAQDASLSYAAELQRLKDWIAQRIQWVDTHIDMLDPLPTTITFLDAEGNVIKTCTAYQGATFSDFPAAPEIPGYLLDGWNYEVNMTFDEFLTYSRTTESQLRQSMLEYDMTPEEVDAYIADLKENGFYDCGVANGFTFVYPNMTLQASYIDEANVVKAKRIYVAQKRIGLTYDKNTNEQYSTAQIVATTAPDDAYGNLSYTSSDESVATVDEWGEITPTGIGDCTISISAYGGASAKVYVRVYADDDPNIDYSVEHDFADEAYVSVGGYKQICTIDNENFSVSFDDEGSVSYYCLDPDIADIDEAGVVHGLKAGTAHIVRLSEYNDIEFCKVTVHKAVKVGQTYTRGNVKYQVIQTGNVKAVKAIGLAKKKVKNLYIPNAITIYGDDYAVTSIKGKAFCKNKYLKSVTLGENVKYINAGAFCKNKNLKDVTICASKAKVAKSAFAKNKKGMIIYVPETSKSYYKKVLKGKKLGYFAMAEIMPVG